MSTLCPNSCRQTARIGGGQLPPLPPVPYAYVHSHLTYGIHVWGNSMTIKKIITLQKRAIRTINKVWYRSHTEPLFKSIQILTFEDMYTMQISLFVYDLNNDLLPRSFSNLLSQNCLIVQQISAHIWLNCAFNDTSMKFGTLLEYTYLVIFGYRPSLI